MLRKSEINRLCADLPGYEVLHTFSAALPLYECELEVRLMIKQELSALQQYSLDCIYRGLSSVDAIDVVLGAGRQSISRALAALLDIDLVVPRLLEDGGQAWEATAKGVDALLEVGWKKPEVTTVRVLFDGLTSALVAPNRIAYVNPGECSARGLHIIPPSHQALTHGDVDISALRKVVRYVQQREPHRLPEGDLHDLLGVGATRLVYRHAEVVAFLSSDDIVVFRVLDRGKRLRDYEEKLTAMFPQIPEILPFERDSVGLPTELSPLLSQELLEKADEIEEKRDQLITLIQQGEKQEQASVVLPEAEEEETTRSTAPTRVSNTRAELEVLKAHLAEVEKEHKSLRMIQTEEHRTLLEKALKHARNRVIIVSPWLESAAINHALQELMRRAIARGVEIVIGWGMPPSSEERPGANRDEKSQSMLRQLERMAKEEKEALERTRKQDEARYAKLAALGTVVVREKPTDRGHSGGLRVVRLGDTHEKILISDTKFAVVTSFNFLSFRGDPRRGFRRETGIYHENKNKIEELARDIMSRIEQTERSAAPGDRDTVVVV